jgi:hypothetical protein
MGSDSKVEELQSEIERLRAELAREKVFRKVGGYATRGMAWLAVLVLVGPRLVIALRGLFESALDGSCLKGIERSKSFAYNKFVVMTPATLVPGSRRHRHAGGFVPLLLPALGLPGLRQARAG